MVPTWLSVAALACLVVAVELQVRLIEEPYLLATHGSTYQRYAAATGRFVLGIGRFKTPDTQEVSL
jgi:protein-S-isoprenylcysteine O-methyltransferase Ste14